MHLRTITSIGLCSVTLSLGCRATGNETNTMADVCPEIAAAPKSEGWTLGEGDYRAEQKGSEITVFASGDNPTHGYQNTLALDPAATSIPTLTHHRKAPSGMVAQVLTPFKVCARFKGAGTIKKIEVQDKGGSHVVSVKQP